MFKKLNFKNSFQIKNFKLKILVLFIELFVYSFIGLFSSSVGAESMSSDNYTIELKQTEEQTQKIPVITPPPEGEKTFSIITTDDFFEFSVSDTTINFGMLTPTNPIIRTTTLSTNRSKSIGYFVTAYENHELINAVSPDIIPDTTCDDGFCKEDIASTWSNILTYGFGYRCDNLISSDCADDFLIPETFKHFANNSKQQSPQTVLRATANTTTGKSEIIYKINISNTFKPNQYSNTVTYIAVPTY